MVEFNPDITFKSIVSKIGNKDEKLDSNEIALFKTEVEKDATLDDDQKKSLYEYAGLELGHTSGPRKANSSGSDDGDTTTINIYNPEGDVNINLTKNWYIEIKVQPDTTEAIQEFIKSLIKNNNANFDKLIKFLDAKLEGDKNYILEFIKGMFQEFKNSNEVDLSQVEDYLKQILERFEAQGEQINNMYNALMDLLTQQFDTLNMTLKSIGVDMNKLVDLVKESNLKQDEQVELLTNIYDAIQKLTNHLKDKDKDLLAKLDEIVVLIKNGNASLEDVVALLNAIKADTSENNKIGKQILEKQDAILAAIKEIGIDVKSIDASTKNMLIQLLAQAEDMTEIKNLLKDMKKDLEEGNNISKEILAAIKNLGTDIAVDLDKIYNRIGQGGTGGGGMTAEQFEKLLAAINRNTDAVNNNTEVSVQNKKDIIAAINKLGDDMTAEMSAGFNAILAAIQNGDEASQVLLEKVLAAINNNTEVSKENAAAIIAAIEKLGVDLGDKIDNLDLTVSEGITNIIDKMAEQPDYSEVLQKILDALNKLDGDVNNNFATVITLIGQRPNIDIQALLNKMDDIIAAIQDHDVNVTVDVTGKVTCECNCGNGGGGNPDEGVHVKGRKAFDEVFNVGNDSTGINNVPTQQKPAQKGIYDMNGRRMNADSINDPSLPKGIYIVDGKKVVKN